MKKIYTLLLISTFSFYFSLAQYTWTQKANYGGGAIYVAAAFSIGAKGYIGIGLDAGINVRKDFWEYDTLSNSWTQKADFGGGVRMGAVAFSIGNYGYMGLGTSAYPSYNWVQDFWQYDPISNTWTRLGNFPGPGRYGLASFTIGNKGYIGCGWNGSEVNDFWQYNPSIDSWVQKAYVGGGGRESSTGFAINNKGYITTGLIGGSPSNDLWEYDTLANTWTQKTNLPGTARYGATSFVLCNYAYIGLGSVRFPSQSEVKDFWRYDPSADSWIRIIDFQGSARNGVIDFVIGNSAYIATGAASTALSGFTQDLWQFNPSCTSLSATASFQSSDSTICINSCVNFTDHSSNATSWFWSFPGGTPSSSTDENPQSICYFHPGHYNVTLIASNSIGADTLQLTNYINVNIAPPTPVITLSHDSLYCSIDSSYISYQWYYYNSLIPGATDTSLVAYYNGNYNIEVTNGFGCSIAVGITIVLGLEEESDPYFNIYPNPVCNYLELSLIKTSHSADIEIYDITGRRFYQRILDSLQNNKLTFDFASFAPGVYFILLNADGKRVTKKILKVSSTSE